MRLSNIIILALKGLSHKDRKGIAKNAGVHVTTFNRWLNKNDDNLTKAGVLVAIRKGLNIEDSEKILEEKPVHRKRKTKGKELVDLSQ